MFTKRGPRVADEAAALAIAGHPGVVELVDAGDGWLRTHMVDGAPVGELPPLSAGEVAGLAAAVATTLADLHGLGVVHGGVEAGHVLVTSDGRPVLCSLGRGGAPADDVAALGRLVTALLAAAPPETGGHRRVGRRRRRPGWLGPMLAPPAGPALALLAAEATAPDPAARPSARALADAIGRRIPAARLPRPGPAAPAPIVRRGAAAESRVSRIPRFGGKDRRIATVLAPKGLETGGRRPSAGPGATAAGRSFGVAATIVVVGAVVAAGVWALSRPTERSGTLATRRSGTAGAAGATGGRAPTQPVATSSTTPALTAPAATRVWPPEPLQFRDGVLTYRGARYALGQPGDSLVAGDWRCTGVVTLALLRRDAGEVFAFDGWPEPNHAVTGRPVGKVHGATELRAVDVDGDSCPELEVARAGAPPVRLRVGS